MPSLQWHCGSAQCPHQRCLNTAPPTYPLVYNEGHGRQLSLCIHDGWANLPSWYRLSAYESTKPAGTMPACTSGLSTSSCARTCTARPLYTEPGTWHHTGSTTCGAVPCSHAQVLPNKCLAPSRDGCRAPSSRWVAPGRRRARHAHGAPQARTSAHASKDLHARTAMSQGTRCLACHLHASLQQTRMARGRQCTCWVVMLPCANHVHNRRAHSGRRRRAWCA